MLAKLNSLVKIKEVLGIEIALLSEDKLLFTIVQLEIKKGIVFQVKSLQNEESLSKLAESFNPEIPVCLSINGRGILHKKSPEKTNSDPRKALISVLPNAKPEDFYIQETPSTKGVYLSVIRKATLEDIINKFKQIKFSVISITLGPFAINNLLPLINVPALSFGSHVATVSNNLIDEYSYSNGVANNLAINVDSEQVEAIVLVAYASAFQVLFPVNKIELPVHTVVENREEFQNKKVFKVLGWGSLLFFLCLLLANFFLFNYFSEENKRLLSHQTQYTGLVMNVDTLQKKVRQKEEFLLEAGWLSPAHISFYSDQIANSIPTTILLTELFANPVDKVLSKQARKSIFKPNIIHVAGYCNRATDLNPWVNEIGKWDWIEKVEVDNYFYDDREQKGNFILTIFTK